MVKKKKSNENNRYIIMAGVTCNCGDGRLLLASLLLLCLLATTTLLVPLLSPADVLYSSSATSASPGGELVATGEEDIAIKRSFSAVGRAAYLFVQMGAYRGGGNTFAVVGLASKPLHVYSRPHFGCRWVPHNAAAVSGTAYKMLPDWGYGRVYTVVVVNCTFAADVGADGSGGRLVVVAGIEEEEEEEEFVALEEAPWSVNMSLYSSPPKYDYLYCGSPLYGGLSPQRVREWLAYHVDLFGGGGGVDEKSHFVIHDAGGVHREVKEVLRPWIGMGVVTLQDVRGQERFDGYYHNQFLVVNDCLHRYRFMAKWIFFFDLDEFIHVHPTLNLHAFMDTMKGFTQFTIEQMTMSAKLCVSEDAGQNHIRKWGMEKMVYRDAKRGIRRDRKYAIQPRNAFAAGVHLSLNFAGRSTNRTEGKIKYFHYHGTLANRRETCREFVNATATVLAFEGRPYVRDDTLRKLAGSVKMFEAKAIGLGLRRTRQ